MIYQVDTAVKTSRSGYLQRCLIKHMEDLVCYVTQSAILMAVLFSSSMVRIVLIRQEPFLGT